MVATYAADGPCFLDLIGRKIQYISAFNMLEDEGHAGLLQLVHRENHAQAAAKLLPDGPFVVEATTQSSNRQASLPRQGARGCDGP